MSIRDILAIESPLAVWLLITGGLMWVFILGAAFMFALVGTAKVVHTLVTARLEDDPQRTFPPRGL